MGAKIPSCVANTLWHERLEAAGLRRVNQGKVRDTYQMGSCLLQVTTNRISAYDFVFPAEVPNKGAILTAMTVHWLARVLKGVPHHLVAFGGGVSDFLPVSVQRDQQFQGCALVVSSYKMEPVECIIRAYLTGSGWTAYKETGRVCGHVLPEGLHDGSRLPEPIFTPTTKAEEGHDEHIGADTVNGELAEASLNVFRQGSVYAGERGIILADTKFEWGRTRSGRLILCDEVLTPDSSRTWDREEWEQANVAGKAPDSYDKEVFRQWCKTVETPWGLGINNLDPRNPQHVAFVHSVKVPEEVVQRTEERYHTIFERQTGMTLNKFQREVMGIAG